MTRNEFVAGLIEEKRRIAADKIVNVYKPGTTYKDIQSELARLDKIKEQAHLAELQRLQDEAMALALEAHYRENAAKEAKAREKRQAQERLTKSIFED